MWDSVHSVYQRESVRLVVVMEFGVKSQEFNPCPSCPCGDAADSHYLLFQLESLALSLLIAPPAAIERPATPWAEADVR